jgi:Fe-S cluster biogenesis protein NfuA
MSPLHDAVSNLLSEAQPALGLHGGSIRLVEISPAGVVKLEFQGACVGCAAADITLEFGLKEMLMLHIPEITDVISVNTEPTTHPAPTSPYAFN